MRDFPGRFIDPDTNLALCADPAASLGLQILSGYRAIEEAPSFAGRSSIRAYPLNAHTHNM